jgi:tetratricopeptide (TPR) repeat protein
MKLRTITMSVAGLMVLAGAIAAQTRFDSLRAKDFQAGFSGNPEQLDKLMAIVEEALAANPKNPMAQMTHGIGTLRRAGDAVQKGDMEKSGKMFQAGLEEMEEAVRLAPDNVEIRIPRGGTLITASRFMPPEIAKPILTTGISDFEKVLETQERDQTFAKLSDHQRGELLTGLADGWNRAGNSEKARAFFERIVTELNGSIYQKRAKDWLENKPESKSPTFFACNGCHVE